MCAVHVVNYVRNAALTISLDAEARTAICPRCLLVVGHNGNAAHRCV